MRFRTVDNSRQEEKPDSEKSVPEETDTEKSVPEEIDTGKSAPEDTDTGKSAPEETDTEKSDPEGEDPENLNGNDPIITDTPESGTTDLQNPETDNSETTDPKTTDPKTTDPKTIDPETSTPEKTETTETEATESADKAGLAGASSNMKVELRSAQDFENAYGDAVKNLRALLEESMNSTEGISKEDRKEALRLDQYPRDPHDLSYYGDSPRVRYLETAEGNDQNFLVYRDSFLILSEKESESYTVEMSEDKRSAVVTPSIAQEDMDGKDGIVFLREDVSTDIILVLDRAPQYFEEEIDDPETGTTSTVNKMECSLEDPSVITFNRLFSDGNMAQEVHNSISLAPPEGNSSGRPLLRGKIGYPGIKDYQTHVTGTNWECEYSDPDLSDVDFDFDFDPWDLELGFAIRFSVKRDFEITTTGASGGREEAQTLFVQVNIPNAFSEVNFRFSTVAEFDDHPIHMKGVFNDDVDISLDLLEGLSIKDDNCYVDLKEFYLNENNPKVFNDEIKFYLGSRQNHGLGVGEFSIVVATIGPVLSIYMNTEAGTYYTIKFDRNNPGDTIHLCSASDELPGCLYYEAKKSRKRDITGKVDLFFDDWKFDIKDLGEKPVGEPVVKHTHTPPMNLSHNLLDFLDSEEKIKPGRCKKLLHKVPVKVFDNEESMNPVGGVVITAPEAQEMSWVPDEYKTGTTPDTGDKIGYYELFLPIPTDPANLDDPCKESTYLDNYKYQIEAKVNISGQDYDVTVTQLNPIREGLNDQVNIYLGIHGPKAIYVEKKWDIDDEGKDRPEEVKVVLQRKAGDQPWETIAPNILLPDQKVIVLNEDNNWKWSGIGFDPDYDYRVRELEENWLPSDYQTYVGAAKTLIEDIQDLDELSNMDAAREAYLNNRSQIAIKLGSVYNVLPDDVATALYSYGPDPADGGTLDQLLAALTQEGITSGSLSDRIQALVGFMEDRGDYLVYDSNDADKAPKLGSKPNYVIYNVEGDPWDPTKPTEGEVPSDSASATTSGKTMYKVTYEKNIQPDRIDYTITNKAVKSVKLKKNWATSEGREPANIPASAYVVLTHPIKTADGSYVYLPVILDDNDPNGMDPLTLFGDIVGLNLDWLVGVFQKLGVEMPRYAITKATGDNDWTVNYTVDKYSDVDEDKVADEFVGTELNSDLLRNIIYHLTNGDIVLPITYKPLENFITIPSLAAKTVEGMNAWLDNEGYTDWLASKGIDIEALESMIIPWLPRDYNRNSNVFNVEVDYNTDWDYDEGSGKYIFTVNKKWKDKGNEDKRPAYVMMHVVGSFGTDVCDPIRLDQSNDWSSKLEFTEDDPLDLPIICGIKEEYPEGFDDSHYTSMVEDVHTIVNTYNDKIPDTIMIQGRKIWDDYNNRDGIRPEKVTIYLLANGKRVSSLDVYQTTGWEYFFADMPRYDGTGKEIVYEVDEAPVTGYDKTVIGYNIINSRMVDTISVSGKKIWDDEGHKQERPDNIEICLVEDGIINEDKKITVTEANGWAWSFDDLPKYDKKGILIHYGVFESPVEPKTISPATAPAGYYKTEISGYDVKNTYVPNPTTDPDKKNQVNVWVVWDDNDDQDGIRPSGVEVQVTVGGTPVDPKKTLTESGNWTGSFYDLASGSYGINVTETDVIHNPASADQYSYLLKLPIPLMGFAP